MPGMQKPYQNHIVISLLIMWNALVQVYALNTNTRG